MSIEPSDDEAVEARVEVLASYVGSSSFKCSVVVADRNGRILSWSISAAVDRICVARVGLSSLAALKAGIGCLVSSPNLL